MSVIHLHFLELLQQYLAMPIVSKWITEINDFETKFKKLLWFIIKWLEKSIKFKLLVINWY